MDHIKQLSAELLANPNDMMVRMALTDACAEVGVYCPDLLGQSSPPSYISPYAVNTPYCGQTCSYSKESSYSISRSNRGGGNFSISGAAPFVLGFSPEARERSTSSDEAESVSESFQSDDTYVLTSGRAVSQVIGFSRSVSCSKSTLQRSPNH